MAENPRVALVTGGAVGIGRSTCLRLAADGVAVAIGYHSRTAEETVAEICASGGAAFALELDVTDSARVPLALEAVVDRFGRLDILVNNAGGLLARVPAATMSDDHWHRVLSLNLTSAFRCTQAAIPYLGNEGRIINIASLAADNGGGDGASAYAAAKAGLIGFTRATAKELGPRGITVNAINPGYIAETPFHDTFSSEQAKASMTAQAAVGRPGSPGDIAAVVSFLASVDAGYISGAVVDVNGGSYFT